MAIPYSDEYPEINPRLMPVEVACNLSDQLKQLYFSRLMIGHPRMAEMVKKLTKMIQPESGFDIVLAIGPTGVGKSSLLDEMVRSVMQDFKQEMIKNTGLIPVIGIEIPESGQKQFAWSALYTALLEQTNDQLTHKKVETLMRDGVTFIKPRDGRSSSVTALQMALKNQLIARGTRLVVIDEAPHLLGHLVGNDLLNLANAFKSLSNVGRTTLVLAGSYDLLRLMKLSSQLSRRICVVHFNRYGASTDDKAVFQNSLSQMQSFLPTKIQPDLLPFISPLQHACMGCIGIAKETLQRALTNVLENRGTWTLNHLQDALLSDGALEKIREEVLKGENDIRKFTTSTCLTSKESGNRRRHVLIPKRNLTTIAPSLAQR